MKNMDVKKRVCLWCSKYFISSGAGNRKCPKCKCNKRENTRWGVLYTNGIRSHLPDEFTIQAETNTSAN